MKKIAAIFLVFIYALSTTGFALKADYCCNHLTSVKIVLADDAKNKEGCCSVKYQSFKVKDAHAASDVVTAPLIHCDFTHILSSQSEIATLSFSKNHQHVNIHAPPLLSSVPVYISNCVFRI